MASVLLIISIALAAMSCEYPSRQTNLVTPLRHGRSPARGGINRNNKWPIINWRADATPESPVLHRSIATTYYEGVLQ
jgi:hypothetical protein